MKTKRLTARFMAFVLALLMITSGMVFGVGAEDTATDGSTTETTTTATAPTIVPVSDCDSTDHWSTSLKLDKDKDKDKDNKTQGDGSLSLSFKGIYDGTGALQWTWKNTDSPLDITGMKVLHFDLYLENAAAVANAKFEVELRDADHVDAVNEGGTWYEYEAHGQLFLCDLIEGEVREGWNTVEIPLDKLTPFDAGKYDITKIAYFRMFSCNTGKDTSTGLYSAPWNIIGTEGKTTTVKLDNVYFASESLAEAQTDALILIEGGNAGKSAKLTSASGEAAISMAKNLGADTDISGKQYLELDVYISDVALAGKTRFDIELTSAGKEDYEEDGWSNVSLSKLAEYSGVKLSNGWNHLKVALSDRATAGNLKMAEFDYFRIFSRIGTNATEKGKAEEADSEASTSDKTVTTNINKYYESYFKEGESCYVALGRVMLTGREDEHRVLISKGTGTSNAFGNISGKFSDVDNDGIKEWVWRDDSTSDYVLSSQAVVAYFSLRNATMPKCANFKGVTFEIWMSDVTFADGKFDIEFTSAGQPDSEELQQSCVLKDLMDETPEANKWQTVTIPSSKLTGGAKGFVPEEFDFMRLFVPTNQNYTFANGLTVAVRNIYALNYDNAADQTADGVTVLNGEDSSKYKYTNGQTIKLTGVDGNPDNTAFPMLNVDSGKTLVGTGATSVNDVKLSEALDISKCDWMSFDLYLENFSTWGDKVTFLMGLSSSGTCDYQQITSSGKTIVKMFDGHVVNADGTKGELKDGWNHIELPIYELFSSGVASKMTYTDDIGDHKEGETIEDENYKGSFRPANFNFFRSYVNTQESAITATKKAVAAIDNIKFFDGDTIGTRDNKVIYSNEGQTIYKNTDSYNAGIRVDLMKGWPMDASDKVALQMDVYVEKMDDYTGNFCIEISSNPLVGDRNERTYTGKLQDLGAVEGEWTTIQIPKNDDYFAYSSTASATEGEKEIDFANITRISIYNNGTALPAGYTLKVRNVGFVTETVKTGIISAQPTVTESIDFTTQAKFPASSPAAFEYVLGSGENETRVMTAAVKLAEETKNNKKYAVYSAQFTDIHAHRMADTLTMKLWTLDENNKLVEAESKEYSVRQYAENMIAQYSDNAVLVTLLSDMLTYGAAVQQYGKYSTDNLATNVTGVTLTPTVGDFTKPDKALALTGEPSEGGPTFYSAALVLGGTVKIRVKFTADSVESLVVNASIEGKTSEYKTFQQDGSHYYVDIPVPAGCFNSDYKIYFDDADSYSLTYSVGAYVANKYNAEEAGTDGSLSNLLVALTRYGNSAVAYADAISEQQ